MHRFETRAYAGMVRAFAQAGVSVDDLEELKEHSLLDACDAFWISDEIRVEVIRTMPWAEVERMFQGEQMPHCERWPVTATAILQRRECPLVLAVLLYAALGEAHYREGRQIGEARSLDPYIDFARMARIRINEGAFRHRSRDAWRRWPAQDKLEILARESKPEGTIRADLLETVVAAVRAGHAGGPLASEGLSLPAVSGWMQWRASTLFGGLMERMRGGS